MSSTQRATTTIVTFTDPQTKANHVLLCISDPRLRVGRDGTYHSTPALDKDGKPNPLPLDQLKFIGGNVDAGETIEEAALRELAEEAGPEIADMARAGYIKPAYEMTRDSTQQSGETLQLSYIHAHLGNKTVAEVKAALAPNDDVLGIAIADASAITLKDGRYVVEGASIDCKLRENFQPIDYEAHHALTSEHSRAVFDAYNQLGPTDPFTGLDLASLTQSEIELYTPKGADHSLQCSPDASVPDGITYGGSGGVCPDGAIFVQLVRPLLKHMPRGPGIVR